MRGASVPSGGRHICLPTFVARLRVGGRGEGGPPAAAPTAAAAAAAAAAIHSSMDERPRLLLCLSDKCVSEAF